MANALVQSNPNLWASTVHELERIQGELEVTAKQTVELAIQAGEILSRVKSTLKHGEWLPWIKEFAPFSEDSAERYLWCFNNQSKIRSLRNLSEAYRLKLTGDLNGSDEPAKLHEPNFHSQAVRMRANLVSAFNHYLQRRPLKSWATEEIYDLVCSLTPLAEVVKQLELELSTRDDLPPTYR